MTIKIITKVSLLFFLVGLPYVGIKSCYVWNYDINYYKATGKANHLILGLSRAKRGLSPAIFEKELGLEGRMLNFAFNNLQSPYGPAYYKAVKSKVIKQEHKGLYLLSVTPGGVMNLVREDGVRFREDSFFYYKLWSQNSSPNWEYILRSPVSNGSLFQFIRNKYSVLFTGDDPKWPEIIHPDGWGELDISKRASRIKPLILNNTYVKSSRREMYLEKTISFLKQHGTVILIRLPIGKEYQEYEEILYPNFDTLIYNMAKKHQVQYLNYFKSELNIPFHDGHHLFGEGAEIFTLQLVEELKQIRAPLKGH